MSDEGVKRPDSFFSLVNYGKIKPIAPRRVASFSSDGSGVILDDGTTVKAGALVLATGYSSSWTGLFRGKFPGFFLYPIRPPLTLEQKKP